jgi:hypothetical protein
MFTRVSKPASDDLGLTKRRRDAGDENLAGNGRDSKKRRILQLDTTPLLLKGQRRLEQILRSKEDGEYNTEKRRRLNTVGGLANIANDLQSSNSHLDIGQRSFSGKENKRSYPTSILNANIRSLSLLERIRMKEFNQANEAHGLSKAELGRQAAFQRAEELLGILDLLAASKGSGQRVSFPLPALVRSVQNSLRSPMSKDEIERCLQVLEKEVAPWYISMAKFGNVVGVVVNRGFRPTKEDVQARLATNTIS